MNDNAVAILDAAERRIRLGGFNGFSFREIASDVGIKSSSVHYHFPTKEILAAAVIRRYTETTAAEFERRFVAEPDPVRVFIDAFRETIYSKDRMCPCAVLGASTQDLPSEVRTEVGAFFKMCLNNLVKHGLSLDRASEVLATITGAQVVANSLGDFKHFDRAVRALLLKYESTKK